MSTLVEMKESPARDRSQGDGLAFIIGPFRGGTTLLRKMLDSHRDLYSPAETWFLLPLLNLWTGDGETARFNPKQSSVALQSLTDRETFVRAARAFAARIYDHIAPRQAKYVIDKTPLYLSVAHELAEIFPASKFIVLTRDPRSILWSRHTWQHMQDVSVDDLIPGVAQDIQRQAAFFQSNPTCSHIISYEALCMNPSDELARLVEFLGVPFDERMITYGDHAHHEGYGDESTRQHRAPHTDSLDRWRGSDGLNESQQVTLLDACGTDAIKTLQLDTAIEDLERMRSASATIPDSITLRPAATSPTVRRFADRRRVLFFLHPGRNSRDILLDMADGFRRAECEVLTWELGTLWHAQQSRPQDAGHIAQDFTQTVHAWMQSNGIDLSIGMWANALTALAPTERNSRRISYFDAAQSPHIMFWLDAPYWAHNGSFHPLFRTPLLQSTWCFNLINNPATAAEMSQLFGFTNVAPLNYGINPDIVQPYASSKKYDVVMSIGPGDPEPTKTMLRELESDDPDVSAIRSDFSDVIRDNLREAANEYDPAHRDALIMLQDRMLESQLAAPHTPMLDRLVGVTQAHPDLAPAADWLINQPKAYLSLSYSLRQLENWQRPFVITYLSRHFNCAVFGDAKIDAWPCRAERLGEIAYADQSKAYSLGHVALNVMRWQDDVGMNLKPFEITGSGAPFVMAHRTGVDACFVPDEEVVLFKSPGEGRVRIKGLLDDESTRARIGRAGYERTQRDHTWKRRAETLLSLVGKTTRRWA